MKASSPSSLIPSSFYSVSTSICPFIFKKYENRHCDPVPSIQHSLVLGSKPRARELEWPGCAFSYFTHFNTFSLSNSKFSVVGDNYLQAFNHTSKLSSLFSIFICLPLLHPCDPSPTIRTILQLTNPHTHQRMCIREQILFRPCGHLMTLYDTQHFHPCAAKTSDEECADITGRPVERPVGRWFGRVAWSRWCAERECRQDYWYSGYEGKGRRGRGRVDAR
jgi:hypothetical protein